MVSWVQKLLLVTALLVLPLQGIAMATTFEQCHEQTAAQTSIQAHEHSDGAQHHHDQTDEGTSSSFAGHLCGYHFVLHLPATLSVAPAPEFAVWASPASLSYTPHFPEQPRRPPRA